MTNERLSRQEGFERAVAHRLRARNLRAGAEMAMADADRHDRWAKKWTDWADDEYGEVAYPGRESVDRAQAQDRRADAPGGQQAP